MRKSLNLVSAVIVYALVAVGCVEDSSNKINEQTVLPPTERSLTGTKWKLVGFYDTETKTLKELEPTDCEKCYVFIFYPDSIGKNWLDINPFNNTNALGGYACVRPCHGYYKIDYSTSKLEILFWNMTYAPDFLDGNLYVETMNKVQNFLFSGEELKLYYNDKKNYLLFKRYYLLYDFMGIIL